MTEQLKGDSGETSQLSGESDWTNFSLSVGQNDGGAENLVEQSVKVSEDIENVPDYLMDIDPNRRKEIIDTSAEMTRDIPGAIICGGNANRILYEAYTGRTMFGVGKNDSDIYVSHAVLESLLAEQPDGYELKHELDEDGQERWIHPEDDYIVLVHSEEHIDVFGVRDTHEFVEVELDGQNIRVQSLVDQIRDKVRMMYETEGLTKIKIDPIHNPDPVSKYGVYAQRILEMADSERGRAELNKHADELPEDWREVMEIMASMGEYGDRLDSGRDEMLQKKIEDWKRFQEKCKQIQDQMISELRAYYETNRDKTTEERSGSLPSLVSGLENMIEESLNEASDVDDFIRKVIGKMSADEKREIKDRIKAVAGADG